MTWRVPLRTVEGIRGLVGVEALEALWQEVSGQPPPEWLADGGDRQGTRLSQEEAQRLADLLIEWVQAPNWEASQAHITQHAKDLLTEAGQAVLGMLLQGNPGHPALEQRFSLLVVCMADGVDSAFTLVDANPIELYTHAVSHAGNQAIHYRNRAGEYIRLCRFDVAEADLKQAEKLEPDAERLPDLWSELGNAYSDNNQPDKAIEVYSMLLDRNPDQAWLLCNRAGEYIKLRRFDAARADLENAEEREPKAHYLFMHWSEFYAAQDDGKKALEYAQKLQDTDPDSAGSRYQLAVAQALVGQMDEALGHIQQASQLADNKQRGEGLRALEELKKDHPHHSANLDRLIVNLKKKPAQEDGKKEQETLT